MASVLDPTDPEVRAAAEAARQILVGLGAHPFLERLEAALARTAAPGADAPSSRGRASVPGASSSVTAR